MLGYWARRLAEGGLLAVLTATSPPRLGHPDGGPKLDRDESARDRHPELRRRPIVSDVSMGRVTYGDVIAGAASEDELVPFGGEHAHKAFALAIGCSSSSTRSSATATARCCSLRSRRLIPFLRCVFGQPAFACRATRDSRLPAGGGRRRARPVGTRQHVVALTFDGGGNADAAPRVLAVLRREQCPARSSSPATSCRRIRCLSRAIGRRYPVANDTVDHLDHRRLSTPAATREITLAETMIERDGS